MSVARLLVVGMAALFLTGCDGAAKEDSSDSADEDDTGSGGGNTWRAAGSGKAWFVDGASDGSRLHLEVSRTMPPKEGERYWGYVTRGGADVIPLGEIVVTGEDVIYDGEIGLNAIMEGYDGFAAFAGTEDVYGEGAPLWVGSVDTTVYGVIESLLLSSTELGGEGSLRAVETAVQTLADRLRQSIDGTDDVDTLNADAEAVANGIRGAATAEDLDLNGTIEVEDVGRAIYGDDSYVDLILGDLVVAAGVVDPTGTQRDYINYAADCVGRVEDFARYAAIDAGAATGAAGASVAEGQMENAHENLIFALDGKDEDDSGSIDLSTEGTIECALEWVSRLGEMDVGLR